MRCWPAQIPTTTTLASCILSPRSACSVPSARAHSTHVCRMKPPGQCAHTGPFIKMQAAHQVSDSRDTQGLLFKSKKQFK